jgi:Family of unknown function (DUF6712)
MADATNLFNDDVSLLQEAVYFGPNIEWKQVAAFVKRAEKTYLRNIFGTYYTALLPKIGAGTTDANDDALIEELRLASGNLAWWLYIPKHNVKLDSTGIKQVHSGDDKPAFQWATKDLQKAFQESGFEAIENTFEFLELNKVTYAWEASALFKTAKSYFIDSAATFQAEIDIMNSRYLYMQLQPEMARIERDVVQPILGAAAYATLKKKLQLDNGGDNALTAATEEIWLPIIKSLVAFKTIADSIVKRMVLLNRGFLVHNTANSGSENAQQPLELDKLNSFQTEMDRLADSKINELDLIVNPPAEIAEGEEDDTDTLDPDSKIGGLF